MTEKIKIKSLDDLFNNHCEGHRPKKPLVHNGKFTESNRFGKGRKYAIATKDGMAGILQDHALGKTINWYLAEHTFKKRTKKAQKKEPKKGPKDVTQEFIKFPIAKTHPYSEAKRVSILNLSFRQYRGNLIVPFYTLEGHFISGWQAIWSKPKEDGSWPKSVRTGSSNSKIYLSIGPESERIYVAEGVSTALSIHHITKQQVYCTFGKNNLHSVTEYLLDTYHDKRIIVCLDHDTTITYPKITNKRLVFLCPDTKEKDFNDVQDDLFEREKLITCQPVWTPPAETKKELPEDVLRLKKKMEKLGYELRLNTRKDRIEIKGFTSKSWDEVTDEGYSSLFLEVKGAEGKIKKGDFEDRYKGLAHSKQVDPFQEYLKALEWDGQARLERFLIDVFDVPEPSHIPLMKWALKSILLATVRRTFEPGSKHDEFVILQGAQGIGKSSLLFHLFKDKSLFSNTVSFADPYSRIVEGILDKAIIEIAELSGFKRADLEKMKNVISTQKDTVRLPYRRNARDYQRRCVFVGTTNDSTPLPDDLTGLRRFILVSLKGKMGVNNLKKSVKENRDQLWAEAVACYKNGESARLPKELWELSAEVAEDHRGGDHSFEYAFLNAIRGKSEVNIPEVLKELKDGKQMTLEGKMEKGGWIRELGPKIQSKAAEILKRDGYKQARKRDGGQRIRVWIKEEAGDCPF